MTTYLIHLQLPAGFWVWGYLACLGTRVSITLMISSRTSGSDSFIHEHCKNCPLWQAIFCCYLVKSGDSQDHADTRGIFPLGLKTVLLPTCHIRIFPCCCGYVPFGLLCSGTSPTGTAVPCRACLNRPSKFLLPVVIICLV